MCKEVEDADGGGALGDLYRNVSAGGDCRSGGTQSEHHIAQLTYR